MRNLTRAEARTRGGLVRVASYDVQLDLTGGGERFGSTTVVRFACTSPGAASFLELDAPELVEATLNGRPVGIEGNRIALTDLLADNEVRVVARCAYTNTGEGLHRFVDPVDGLVYCYAQAFLDDAQRLYACFDQPDLKAVFRLTVRAPEGWRVLSNMRGHQDGERMIFAQTPPLSTYHLTLAAGAFVGEQVWHGGVELGVWCRRSLRPHLEPEELFALTRASLDFQEELFGSAYPFGDTYDQVLCPEFNAGAMENPGMVTFSDEQFLFPSRVTQGARRLRAQVVAHEMAHMWFGDLVTMQWWDDLWLNESFADLMGVLTVAEALPYDGAWEEFCLARKGWGYRADQLPTTHPVTGEVPDNRSALLNFDGISYAKGASALRQLMALLGRDTFFGAVRAYLARHAWGSSTLADLLAALEQQSGRDLGEWSRSWLQTTGVSTLRVVGGQVVQDSAVLREHRIGVGRYDLDQGRLVLRSRDEVHVRGAATPLAAPLAGAPADLVLLNDGDLTFAKVRFDDRSLATVLSSLSLLADPLARVLCWGALWDATRDAELPAATWVRAVLAGVDGESDPSLVETLLGQAALAAASYAPVADQDRLLAELAQAHHSTARALPGSSDLQLVRTRAHVATTTDVAALEALLSGAAPAGLAVDAELRWWVLRRLSVLGAAGEDRLQAELRHDGSSTGQRHAEWARAARPDAAGKQATWEAVVAGRLSNSQLASYAGGFWQRGQEDLLAGYVDRYLDAVPRFWTGATAQNARMATLRLYPATLFRQDVLDRTDELLALPTLPAGARRVVLEQRDDLARALRAQTVHAAQGRAPRPPLR